MREKRKRKNEDVAKEKRGGFSRKQQALFVFAWAGSYFFTIATTIMISIPFLILWTSTGKSIFLVGWLGTMFFLPTGVIAGTHTVLIKRVLHLSARLWFASSIMGWISGFVIFFVLAALNNISIAPYSLQPYHILMILPVPAAILQWLELRLRVRSAWLWIVVNCTGLILLVIAVMEMFSNQSGSDLYYSIVYSESGIFFWVWLLTTLILTPITLLYLAKHPLPQTSDKPQLHTSQETKVKIGAEA